MHFHRLLVAAACCFCGLAQAASPKQPEPLSLPPLKVLLLPSDVKIYSITAGGSMDIQPDASAAASAETDAELKRELAVPGGFTLMAMPKLTTDDQASLKESLGLYKLACGDLETISRLGGDWKGALERFDYSVGPGLQFLKQRSGADYALVLFGGDGESTGGRVAESLFLAALGIGIPQGRNFMYVGLIDLGTGNIVWLDASHGGVHDFTNHQVLDSVVSDSLHEYPDGELHDSSVSAQTTGG